MRPTVAVPTPCYSDAVAIPGVVALFATAGFALAVPVALAVFCTGLMPHLSTALLATGLMLATLAGTCGLILDSASRGRKEVKRLAYLALPSCRLTGQA